MANWGDYDTVLFSGPHMGSPSFGQGRGQPRMPTAPFGKGQPRMSTPSFSKGQPRFTASYQEQRWMTDPSDTPSYSPRSYQGQDKQGSFMAQYQDQDQPGLSVVSYQSSAPRSGQHSVPRSAPRQDFGSDPRPDFGSDFGSDSRPHSHPPSRSAQRSVSGSDPRSNFDSDQHSVQRYVSDCDPCLPYVSRKYTVDEMKQHQWGQVCRNKGGEFEINCLKKFCYRVHVGKYVCSEGYGIVQGMHQVTSESRNGSDHGVQGMHQVTPESRNGSNHDSECGSKRGSQVADLDLVQAVEDLSLNTLDHA